MRGINKFDDNAKSFSGTTLGSFLTLKKRYIKTSQKTEVTKIEKKLTSREREFCSCFLNTGSSSLAAQRAGWLKNPEQAGEKLLCRKEIADEIEALARQREKSLANMASVGYQRLAFGNISDAVSLLYMENPSRADLSEMDLFLVSEIKRPKDGSMEIKFFDRLKALEKLESKQEEENGVQSLFDAIDEGARSVGSDKAED